MGSSAIYIAESYDGYLTSDRNLRKCSDDFYDTGFYKL